MGLSKASLSGLKVFTPSSIQNNDLDFLETLKFETDDYRKQNYLEKEILELIDEGSFSATEIADILRIDEATISRTISKLRKNEKIVLSSFGDRGLRYYATNCENCPFGTTKSACRKEALSYIVDYFKTFFDVELSAHDFEEIEENQAILKIKRIVSSAKKEKNTKLERSISNGLAKLFGTAVDKSLEIKTKNSRLPEDVMSNTNDPLFKLPILFNLGLHKGAQTNYHLVNEIMKSTKGISKSDKVRIKKFAEEYPKKFLHYAGIDKKF